MINVIINAYACSPSWGSEPGMAWNWVKHLSQYCVCHVITEGEWKEEIETAVAELPHGNNIHFYYNPVSDRVRKICWNQGDWRFYYFYRKWQKKTLKIAKYICSKYKIEVIHHLNMVGFREPGLLWKINGPKYVWGPIGGMDNLPVSYIESAPFRHKIFYKIKNFINRIQYTYQPNVRAAIKRSDILIAAVKGVKDVLLNRYHRNPVLLSETGTDIDSNLPIRKFSSNKQRLDLLWIGRFIYTKRLDIALLTISELKDLDVCLHICGTGRTDEVKMYKQLAESLNITDKCKWYGKVSHDKVPEIMAASDLLFFTSIMEATSTVVLEAIGSCLPVLCFDTCGFGPLINDSIGAKVQLSDPTQSVLDFAGQIRTFYNNRQLIDMMSRNEFEFREQLSWEAKAKQVVQIYESIIKE